LKGFERYLRGSGLSALQKKPKINKKGQNGKKSLTKDFSM